MYLMLYDPSDVTISANINDVGSAGVYGYRYKCSENGG